MRITWCLSFAALLSTRALAQDEAGTPTQEEEEGAPELAEAYENTIGGAFTPGKGFDLVKTERGSLNISAYALVRYLNQMPGNQTFTDHLGNERPVVARHDLNWHRSFVWLSGFLWDPRLQYTMSIWSLPTTEQAIVFGVLRYRVGRALTLGTGIGPTLTARSVQGTWPYWASADRVMAEEFYRGGFASAFFLAGEPIPRIFYTASVNRSISQLGTPAIQDNRSFSYSASVWTLPTTGEYGPRGGFGDFEHHEALATRLGASAAHAHEGRYAPNDQAARNTQLKLSDGVNPFETGALADGVTVEELDYDEIAVDLGFKYRGFSFQTEYGVRGLSDFVADGDVPDGPIVDHAFYAQAMHMVVREKLGLYAGMSYVFDEFERFPWEITGGASLYPFGTRSWRLNFHYIHIERSPTGSAFGFYTAGQTGNTISINTDVLL